MDLTISYFGDAGISFTYNSFQGGVKNLELLGTLRLVLKSSISSESLVEVIEICFLECPVYHFELTTTLAPLNIFFSSDFLISIIKQQLLDRIVFPNKIVIDVKKLSERNEMPEIDVVVRVYIEAINRLEEYKNQRIHLFVELGQQLVESPEAAVDNNGVLEIDFECDLIKYSSDDILGISVIFKDDNEELKTLKRIIDISNLLKFGKINGNFSLHPRGSIFLGLSLMILSPERNDLQIEPIKNSALLEVYIDSVRKLPEILHEAFVELSIENQKQQTLSLTASSPSLKKNFAFFLNDPGYETLTVKLVHQPAASNLGQFSYNVSDLMERQQMKHKLQSFPLMQGIHGVEVVLSLRLRILKFKT